MLAVILAATLSPAPVQAPIHCRAERPFPTVDAGSSRPRKLAEMPDAQAIRAVRRTVAGCEMLEVRAAGAWTLTPAPQGAVRPIPSRR